MSVRRLVASPIPHAVQSPQDLCPLGVLGTRTLSQGLGSCPGPALTSDPMPSWGLAVGPAPGPAAGLRPSAPADACAPARLSVPSRASPPALSGSILLSRPPLPRIPCCATWSPQGQGVINCQVRGGHLESAAWGWSHGEGSSVTPLPAQTLRGPAFPWKFLHCPTLRSGPAPHPAPSAALGGSDRPPPGPGRIPPSGQNRSACRDSSPPPPPGSPTQAGPQAPPLLYCSLLPVLHATPALLPLAVSRWLAQSPGRGRVLLPTAQGETGPEEIGLTGLQAPPTRPPTSHTPALRGPRAVTTDRGRGFCWIPRDSEALAARRVWGLLGIGVGGAGGPPRKV